MDQDQAIIHIINAMSGGLGQAALDMAPQQFSQLASQPGLSQSLVRLLSQCTADAATRLHASVLLKQLITDNWLHEEEAIEEGEDDALLVNLTQAQRDQLRLMNESRHSQSELQEPDKIFLKQSLPALLADPNVILRSNIAFSIATIGEHDFPTKWPDLLPGLLSFAQSGNPCLIQGSLLCFNVLLDKIIDTSIQEKEVVTAWFQTIHQLIQPTEPPTPAAVRIQALDLYSAFIKSFTLVESAGEKGFEKKYEKCIKPSLLPLLVSFLDIIDPPVTSSEISQFETRGCAMKSITRLVAYFPLTLKSAIVEYEDNLKRANAPDGESKLFLTRIASAFNHTIQIYTEYLCLSNSASKIDPQLTEGLAFFINCIISFVDIMTDNTKNFPKWINERLDKFLPAFCYSTMLTSRDVETYQDDVNQFTVDESMINYDKESGEDVSLMAANDAEKTAMVRHESIRFINIALNKWSISAPLLVTRVTEEMWQKGEQMKAQFQHEFQTNSALALRQSSAQHWWKFQEVALICIGRILSSEKGYNAADQKKGQAVQQTFPISTIIQLLLQGLAIPGRDDAEVYLQCRSMWLVAHVIRYLTTQMTTQLHKTKDYTQANQTKELLYQCLNLLPQGLNSQSLPCQIASAHSISQCYQSFIAIDHSVLMYQCQLLNAEFYAQHPTLKADFDRCMATGQPIQLQHQFVNTIPIPFESGFASHFKAYLTSFCRLMSQVEDDGLIAITECVRWIFEFFQQWNTLLLQLEDEYPYLQFHQPHQQTGTTTTNPISPHLTPHAISIDAETMTNVVSSLLAVWFQHTNNNELIELMVEIFHLIAALPNNHINHWAALAYNALLRFIQDPSHGAGNNNPLQQNQDAAAAAFGKTATIGLISITLRSISPGPFAASTTANLDPTKQTNIALISSLQQLQQVIATTPTTFQPLHVSTLIPVDEIIHNLLPAIVQLGLTCNDQTLTSGCCIFSATILAMYSPYLLPIYTTQPHHPQLFPMLKQLALLLFKIDSNTTYPNITDSDSQLGCRLVTQLLVTYREVIGDQSWKELLNLIIHKLCTTEHLILRFQCTYILSRVGIHFTFPLLHYLDAECGTISVRKLVKRGETTRSQKTGRLVKQKDQYEVIEQSVLHTAMNVFLRTCNDIPNGYIKRIVLLFLTQAMSDAPCVQILSKLTSVDDQLIKSLQQSNSNVFVPQSKPFTRAQGSVIEQYSQCNAVTKALKIICDVGFHALLLSSHTLDESDPDRLGAFDDSDDTDDDSDLSEDEEEEFDLGGQDAVSALFGAAADGVRDGTITLDQLWGDDDDDDDDLAEDLGSDRQDNPESPYDRFYGVDLAAFTSSFVQSQQILMNQGHGPFILAREQLTATQQEQVTALANPQVFFQQKQQQRMLEKQQKKQQKLFEKQQRQQERAARKHQ